MFIDGLVTYLLSIVTALVYALFYPAVVFFRLAFDVINFIWGSFYGFIVSFYNLFGLVYNFIYSYIYLLFPASVVGIITLGLFIVIAMRAYGFLKDIAIFGFKL